MAMYENKIKSFFFITLLIFICCSSCKSTDTTSASDLTIHKKKSLNDLLGKPQEKESAIILFTSTDCPIANRMAPEIKRCQDTAKDLEIKFFNIYPFTEITNKKIQDHANAYQLNGIFLADPGHQWVKAFNATITPECFVVIENNKKWSIAYQGRVCNLYPALGRPLNKANSHELLDSIQLLKKEHVALIDFPKKTNAVGCAIQQQ